MNSLKSICIFCIFCIFCIWRIRHWLGCQQCNLLFGKNLVLLGMRKILAELPLQIDEESGNTQLLRIPQTNRNPPLLKIAFKPINGYMEVEVGLPNKNISAAKAGALNYSSMAYKAISAPAGNYFYPVVEDGSVHLRRVSSIFIFSPLHRLSSAVSEKTVLKKAESREELEHRKRSINFKLKNMEDEEFINMRYEMLGKEQRPSVPDHIKTIINEGSQHGTRHPPKRTMHSKTLTSHAVSPNTTAHQVDVTFAGTSQDTTERDTSFSQEIAIAEVIKQTRIVNFGILSRLCNNPMLVQNALYKMTDRIAGRFILKNSYYEKSLHGMRTRLLDLFGSSEETNVQNTKFLGVEDWLIIELADQKDTRYVLKGFSEEVDFDIAAIESNNQRIITETLSAHMMLSVGDISKIAAIDQDIVSRIVGGPGYLYLANNAYAIDNKAHWFNCILESYSRKKSYELFEIKETLGRNGIEVDEAVLISEIKQYCNQRGQKYFLKLVKS